ncbi:recombinase RecT [Clostridium sp.]|uniref:recombinase RecT n=1 Tax=Clostridium sp. TaxID=1506 RepID=UPI00260FFF28|nr:recombinase RecT [Clostridium sp.]
MNNNILEVKKPNNQLVEVDKKELQESVITYLKANNLNLTEVELKQFMLLCMIHNLNPIKKEVYAIKYNDKFDIITNYNEYLKRADATGLLAYYRVEMIENEKDPRYPLKAVFIGKRKDQEQEFRTECRFLEYTTGKST